MPKHAAPRRPSRRKYLLAFLAVPLLLMGTAAAYFALNSGTGNFTVSNAGFTIALAPPTSPAVAPGNGATQTINFTLTNNTTQTLTLNTETATISTDANGGIYDTLGSTWHDTCSANWFLITWGDGGIPLPTQVTASNALTAGQIFVTMPANTALNQNSCAGLSPQISLAVS